MPVCYPLCRLAGPRARRALSHGPADPPSMPLFRIAPRRPAVALPVALVSALTGALLAAAPLGAQERGDAPRRTATPAERPAWPDEGPRRWAPRPTAAAITPNDLRTRLYGFADDSMQGRRIGEAGNTKGTEYIAREFKRLGLKPAGDSGSYFQVLPFGPVGFDKAQATLTVNGAPLAAGADWIPTTPTPANGVGSRAALANVPTVYAGVYGDTAVALDPALVRGKVVVFRAAPAQARVAASSGAPVSFVSCADVPDRFGANAAIALEAKQRADAAAGRTPPAPRVALPPAPLRDLRAQRAGAAAVLVIGLDEMAPATVAAAFEGRNALRPAGPLNPGAPAAATISRKAAEQLFGAAVEQLAVGRTGAPVSGGWEHAWRPGAHPARNVIAVLPGSNPALAAEYVLVGAHNDHVGINTQVVDHDSLRAVNTVTRRQGANDPVCTPTAEQQARINALLAKARSVRAPRRDSIMNGADDDGSGTVVMLEVAERFAREKPARSILFISHQGEEGGLLGSRWFTDHPTVPLENIVAAHNMDMVGKGRAEQVKYGGPNSVQMLGARRLSREFGDIIDSVNANIPQPMAIDRSWDVPANPLNRFCRSDQVNYVRKDIPVVYLSTGYAQDYHQHTDEPQYVDYDHAARLGTFVYHIMRAVADRPTRPAIAGPDPTMPTCGR